MVQQNQHRNLICFMLFAPLQIKHFNYVADGCRRPRQLAWFRKNNAAQPNCNAHAVSLEHIKKKGRKSVLCCFCPYQDNKAC